jgi:N-acetylglucosaminyl-diphospho-decaprenol L-rhamnosyltransferase
MTRPRFNWKASVGDARVLARPLTQRLRACASRVLACAAFDERSNAALGVTIHEPISESGAARPTKRVGLDIVIVAYRCRELLRACLTSLALHPARVPTTVVVVDNASRDGTVEMVLGAFPGVTLVPLEENTGFARATNVGIAMGSNPAVLALNPDTRVLPGSLDRMIRVLEERPEVGIAGCRLEQEDGTFDHASRRSFPTVLGAVAHFTGLGRRENAPPRLAQYRAPDVERGPVDAVNGAFMLIRRSALERVGLFDEGYWLYMEDLDLCYRFADAGWTTWYEPEATVVHAKGGTSGRHRSPRANYAFHYGMARFYRKFYAPRKPSVLNAVVYAGIATKLGYSMIANAARRALHRRGAGN